jgi:hypothetical protein
MLAELLECTRHLLRSGSFSLGKTYLKQVDVTCANHGRRYYQPESIGVNSLVVGSFGVRHS